MPPEDSDATTGARRRANLTGRAAMLALVVCMLAISLAYPLREYLAQRGEIGEYQAKVAEQRERVAELEQARRRWQDPAYVEAQARDRLHYVMPGETSYVVLEADEAPAPDGVIEQEPAEAEPSPWFADLWHSVEAAGRADGR
jgi:cell division protein FtsB